MPTDRTAYVTGPDASRETRVPTEVQRRPLTRDEARVVVAQIRDSPKITGYSAAEWSGGRDTFALVRTDTGELVGALLVHHLLGNWCEVAVMYILSEYQGQGHGRGLMRAALDALADSGKRQLMFFTPGPIAVLADDYGFEVYEDEAAYCAQGLRRRFFLKVVYKVQWRWSLYRLREIRRKRRELDCDFTFQLGVLDPETARRMAQPGRVEI
ncbi:GNAT family N-acetyltransferase [Streptomyces sp. NPDC048604]|uniref:GNAT family N-acetyltransferase n=1 Tax=Streptomyces sp. NPDC048604 TaxID=3365578 RepID=UPI0037164743